MAYINIFVSQRASVTVKNKQIILSGEKDSESFPIEDIQTILFENLQSNVSLYTLSALAQNKVTVYICDEHHLPCAYLLPYNCYYKPINVFKAQTNLPLPLSKQIWKDIVINKILNQHRCLLLCHKQSDLDSLSKTVLSGDSSNVEAIAANKYFKKLFAPDFNRQQENDINSALNYGYAIIRGEVARNLVCHGLQPFLALKHKNIFNNFNLADDLMEVFRPFVDLLVYQNSEVPFDTKYKAKLFNLLNYDCNIGGGNYTLSYAIQIFVQSFLDSLLQEKNTLKFPILRELKAHEFE